jgi:hypothetical protein
MVGQSFTLALDFVVAAVPRAVLKWKRGNPPLSLQDDIYISDPYGRFPAKRLEFMT